MPASNKTFKTPAWIAFSEIIGKLIDSGTLVTFDWDTYHQSAEWKTFVAGYNACANAHNARVEKRYNITEAAKRIFGTRANVGTHKVAKFKPKSKK